MKKIILFLLICQYSFGQITLTPNSVGMNSSATNSVMTAQGNGLVVQKKYTLTNANPNSNIQNIQSCGSASVTTNSLAGILKDPYGDNSYIANSHNCIQYFNNFNQGPFDYIITFSVLDMGTGDTVIISSASGLMKFTGNSVPSAFYIKGFPFDHGGAPYGFIVNFVTNSDSFVGQGFVLKYEAIPFDNTPSNIATNYLGGNSLVFDAINGSLTSGYTIKNDIPGKYSVGLGYNSKGTGEKSISIGTNNNSSSLSSLTIGFGNSSTNFYSNAFGFLNQSNAQYSTAIGFGLISKSYQGITIGSLNNISDNPSSNSPHFSDRIFQIGNGTETRSNALTILRNGNVGFGNTAQTLAPDSRLVIDGFTRLGIDAPKIKMKEITGNMPALNANNTYTHGLTDANILSISLSAEVNNQFIPPNYTGNPSLEYNYYWTAGSLYILNKNGNSAGLAGVPFKALITYKE